MYCSAVTAKSMGRGGGGAAHGKGPSSWCMAAIWANVLSDWACPKPKSTSPVSNSTRMHPMDHMSAGYDQPNCMMISGAR